MENFISSKVLDPEVVNELKGIEKQEQKVTRNKLLYEVYKNKYDFTKRYKIFEIL